MIIRTVLPASIGLVVGVAATFSVIQYGESDHTLNRQQIESANSIVADLQSGALTVDLATMLGGVGSTDEQTLIQLLAAQSDADRLSRLIRETAAMPRSPARRQALLVLFSRLAEHDPLYAFQEANQLAAGRETLSRVFGVWAQEDIDSLLMTLSTEANRARAKLITRSILDTLGTDADILARIAPALPDQLDFEDLRLEAILSQAASEPDAAIATAMQIPTQSERFRALAHIGWLVAREDPAAAMLIGERLPRGSRRNDLEEEVLNRWADGDPRGLIDYLVENPDSFSNNALYRSGALPLLADLDHQMLLDAADRFTTELRNHAKMAALRAWARNDPDGALAVAQNMPPGAGRDQAIQSVVSGYGAENPDAALAWAESIHPRPRGLRRAVLTAIAGTNPELAIHLTLRDAPTQEQHMALQSVIWQAVGQDKMLSIADEILRADASETRDRALTTLAKRWAEGDPDAAFTWLGTHPDVAGTEHYQAVAMSLAQRDPGAAAALTSRVPAQARTGWIQQVAAVYTQVDPNGALDWIDRHPGDDRFAAALPTIASALARQNPQAAIPVMNRVTDPKLTADLTRQIAGSWARTDAAAAAGWVDSLDDSAVRGRATADVASQWARQDYQSAKRWVLSEKAGADRDRALQALMNSHSTHRDLDIEVLEAYSNDDARENGAATMAIRLAVSDPGRAREIADQYVTKPELRERIESAITRPRIVRSYGNYYPW